MGGPCHSGRGSGTKGYYIAQPKSQATSELLLAVQREARAAREALTPRILQRIPRTVVKDKYLGAIDRGVSQGLQRMIAIIGPAGYGKSTILGDIYDQLLEQPQVPWLGLVLCSQLSLSTGYRSFVSYGIVAGTMATSAPMGLGMTPGLVDAAFSQCLCGQSHGIKKAVAELVQTYGRGVLLIDTLDLLIRAIEASKDT